MRIFRLFYYRRMAIATLAAAITTLSCSALQSTVQMNFGSKGLEKLINSSVVLSDVGKYPEDALHIWHLQMTDLKGAPLTAGQYGWGENNNGKVWDLTSRTWTYTFTWGSIRIKFVPHSDSLGIEVVESNRAGSGVILSGATIYALGLHFPSLPKEFANAAYPQLNDGVSGPSALMADYGSGVLAITTLDSIKPIYTGLLPISKSGGYSVLISTTPPEGLASFQPHHDRPVRPGETDLFTVTVRFAPSGTSSSTLVAEVYRHWAQLWPASLRWKDHRVIGTAYLASSPAGDPRRPNGYPNNRRRYFNSSRPDDFDMRNSDGQLRFQEKVLDEALTIVSNLKRLNAQGVITWDIEGEEYPQETSYVCSPDQIATVSPEMENSVKVSGSKYRGMKLDDAYFQTIRDGGFRVGVCIRPQHFSQRSDGTAQQAFLAEDEVAAELIRKMKYAHDRWGATLFYLDSTVSQNGAVLDASVIQKAAEALPDSLLIPEETNSRFYAYTAPFRDFLFHGNIGTDLETRAAYPQAFSAILVNDADPHKLAAAEPDLRDAVVNGDVLMVHADYWQANNDTVMNIVRAAHQHR
jgi:hypothetical protein